MYKSRKWKDLYFVWHILKVQTNKPKGWYDDSAGNTLAVQAWEYDFNPQNLNKGGNRKPENRIHKVFLWPPDVQHGMALACACKKTNFKKEYRTLSTVYGTKYLVEIYSMSLLSVEN